MAHTINNGISKNEKLVDIYHMMKSGDLILHPEFQRNLVWNDAHKENFIDTILMGYPFPEVYFADGELNAEDLSHKTLVVDGQQRLSTIYAYIENDPNLKLKRIPHFSELSLEERERFLYYIIVVRDLAKISQNDIREVFRRINSVSYALNAMEIDNALYDGDFISTAQYIAKLMQNSPFSFFAESEEERMKDVETVLIILTFLEIGAYFTSRKEVDEMIKQYDNLYPNKDKVIGCFKTVISVIEKIDLKYYSIWYTKSGVFTVICELMRLLVAGKEIPNTEKINEILNSIDEEIHKPKLSPEIETFYYYFCQGTASKKGRTIRGEFLRKRLV